HPPYHPQEPFAGRYSPPEQTDALEEQFRELRFPFNHTSASVHEHWQKQLAEHDVDPRSFYRTMQNVHDEAMLHQDHQIGELVKELKARGEWENTLLIIASDHGHPAASYPRFGRGLLDPQPAAWEGALFGEFESHIPLIFVWPGHIEGGRRIEAPVSMIDMLPTVLDLAGLPAAKVAQGQSLAPLLLDKDGWEPRPVVFDEFRVTDDGTLIGNLEIVDGRWGDSLEIRERELEAGEPGTMGRHPAPAGGRWKALAFADVPRLLTYDLDADPRAIHHVVDADLARRTESERQLWRLWREHRALSATFEAGEAADLSSEQIEALRALGYIE
ncbi:MAG: sulfatase-like hydrolase/transferase, partial [Thermoanaerobaculia bacterium]|nr:sulfatase-like hydrolase/transferase [Thermoanaerobaculia bacterium]